jgi:hypothetical protein
MSKKRLSQFIACQDIGLGVPTFAALGLEVEGSFSISGKALHS